MFNELTTCEIEKWPEDCKTWTLHKLSARLTAALQQAAKKSIPMGNMKTTKPFWSKEIAAATKACSDARKIAHESDQQALDYKLAKEFLKQVTLKAQEENWQAYASSLDP